jgi:hypothetical protein
VSPFKPGEWKIVQCAQADYLLAEEPEIDETEL